MGWKLLEPVNFFNRLSIVILTEIIFNSIPKFINSHIVWFIFLVSFYPLRLFIFGSRSITFIYKVILYVNIFLSDRLRGKRFISIKIFLASIIFIFLFINLHSLHSYIFVRSSQIWFTFYIRYINFLFISIIKGYNILTFQMEINLPKGFPSYFLYIFIIIEVISTFVRPFTLGLRLLINISVGHILTTLLNSIFILAKLSFVFVQQVLFGYEIFVSITQTYLFVLLLIFFVFK